MSKRARPAFAFEVSMNRIAIALAIVFAAATNAAAKNLYPAVQDIIE